MKSAIVGWETMGVLLGKRGSNDDMMVEADGCNGILQIC